MLVALTGLSLVIAGQPASAFPPPLENLVSTVFGVVGDDTYVAAHMEIGADLGGSPTITMYPGGSDDFPNDWSCTTTNSNNVFTAACSPVGSAPSGNWICYGSTVLITIEGGPNQSVTGSSGCGDAFAECTASTGLGIAGSCGPRTQPGDRPVPLRCQGRYSDAMAAAWSVRCESVDP